MHETPEHSVEELQQMQLELGQMQLIEQMRIYDVMITLLKHFEPDVAEKLIQAHDKLEFVGPMPYEEKE